jgi:hypothetical protein
LFVTETNKDQQFSREASMPLSDTAIRAAKPKQSGRLTLSEVPSRTVLEFADAVPSGMMLSDQAARSMS